MPSHKLLDPKIKCRVRKNLAEFKKKSKSSIELPASMFDDDPIFNQPPSDQQKNQLPTEKVGFAFIFFVYYVIRLGWDV